MSSLWKTWKRMSHQEYSYQASGALFHSSLNINEVFQEQRMTGVILKQIYPIPNYISVINCKVVRCAIKNLHGRLFIQEIISELSRADPAPWRSPLIGLCFCGYPTSSSATEEGARGALWGPVLSNPHHGQDTPVLSRLGDVYGLIPKGSCGVELEISLVGSFSRKYHTDLLLRDTLGFQGAAGGTNV